MSRMCAGSPGPSESSSNARPAILLWISIIRELCTRDIEQHWVSGRVGTVGEGGDSAAATARRCQMNLLGRILLGLIIAVELVHREGAGDIQVGDRSMSRSTLPARTHAAEPSAHCHLAPSRMCSTDDIGRSDMLWSCLAAHVCVVRRSRACVSCMRGSGGGRRCARPSWSRSRWCAAEPTRAQVRTPTTHVHDTNMRAARGGVDDRHDKRTHAPTTHRPLTPVGSIADAGVSFVMRSLVCDIPQTCVRDGTMGRRSTKAEAPTPRGTA